MAMQRGVGQWLHRYGSLLVDPIDEVWGIASASSSNWLDYAFFQISEPVEVQNGQFFFNLGWLTISKDRYGEGMDKRGILVRFGNPTVFGVLLVLALHLATTAFGNALVRYSSIVEDNGVEVEEEANYDAMPPALRFASRVANLSLPAAGLFIAFGAYRDRTLHRALLIYLSMWAWVLYLLLARTTVISEVIGTYSLFGNIAPGTIAAVGLFFLGTKRERWTQLKDGLVLLIIAASVIALALVPFVDFGSRESGRRYLGNLTNLLEYTAVLPLMAGSSKIRKFIRIIPIVSVFVCGVLIQTRTTFIFLVVQIAIVAWLERKQILLKMAKRNLRRDILTGGALVLLLLIAAIIFVTIGPQARSFQALTDRLQEDTRSGQVTDFFNRVEPKTFLFGAGYPTAGEFTGTGIEGIDVGYVDTLYVGGLPALLFVLCFFTLPPISALRARLSAEDVGVIASSIAFALGLCSSSVINLQPEVIVIAILSGRCYRILHDGVAHRRRVAVERFAI